jgi:hypothetical protein
MQAQHPPEPISEKLTEAEERDRKLWLDYIVRLNERYYRSVGSSGASTWALVGVAAAVLYRLVPQIPAFFAHNNNWRSGVFFFALELDAILFFVLAYILLIYFSLGGIESRHYPEMARRFQHIYFSVLTFAQAALVLAHAFGAYVAVTAPKPLRSVLVVLGGCGWSRSY